ncbi:alanine--tRNA ligase [Chloroflexota bacterium]
MTSDEVRAVFLSFFEEKGHKIIPSSSLIPHGDPTLLLTTAGMVQFKPYFLGEAVPPSTRLASCQKCFRTTDVESVGDSTHLTFFEMLGNFSVGDYFKKEAIGWGWEFVTQRLNLSPEQLWITVFVDDDEAFRIWQETGVSEQRILRFGEKDNFWGPAGSSGPCGPCSEILYDFGEGVGCGKASCAPGCDCGRFSEIWNLVFTQYDQDEAGNRTLLPKPNIDTGMGLERTAAVVQGKPSVYDTDLFAPLLQGISELSGKKYGSDSETDDAIRVVAEHSRGIAFLIADGVAPSNEDRGYVLRRLLRRAALFGKRLGLDRQFLVETAKITIEQMGRVYPELVQRRGFILTVVEMEEARFSETLNSGLELLDGIMEEAKKSGEVPGEQAFKLYDTYGFPVELTGEIAAGRGFSVDIDGFEKEMERQRERARAAHKFDLAEKAGSLGNLDIEASNFVGYVSLEQQSEVIHILAGDKSKDTVEEGEEAEIILSGTPFYGEMGGQVGDAGEILGSGGRFSVTDTIRTPQDTIMHHGRVVQGSIKVGDEVVAKVDKERRLDIARNHTATHLLQFALRKVLGEHVQQRGSLVTPDRFRFDFSHLAAMTKEEIHEAQRIVNERIRQNLRVYDEELPYRKAIEDGAIALFDEKYGDTVRVLKIGEPFISAELCGGTHVSWTGEIGYIQVIGESSIGAGLRRIEAVTGRGAEAFIGKRLSDSQEIAESLDAELDDVLDKLSGFVTQVNWERKQRQFVENKLAKRDAELLLAQAEEISGVTVLITRVPSSRIEILREMSDMLRERLKSAVIVLGTVHEGKPVFLAAVTPDLVAKGYNAGDIVKQVAEVTGGGGGGKATLAQAGGKHKDKLEEALSLAKKLIQRGDVSRAA